MKLIVGQKVCSRVTQRWFRVLQTATVDQTGEQLVKIDADSWEADWWPASRFYAASERKRVKAQIVALLDQL